MLKWKKKHVSWNDYEHSGIGGTSTTHTCGTFDLVYFVFNVILKPFSALNISENIIISKCYFFSSSIRFKQHLLYI